MITKGNTGTRKWFFQEHPLIIIAIFWSLAMLLVGRLTAPSSVGCSNDNNGGGIKIASSNHAALKDADNEKHYGASNWIFDLIENPCERIGASQGNQDCILDVIFANIGTTNQYFLEYGFNIPDQCAGSGPNTCRLWRDFKWKGLLLDAENENLKIGLHKHALYSHNIVSILDKYKVPKELDFFSSDMDSHDYFVLRAVLESNKYRPRVISVEYNSNWPLGWTVSMVDPLLNHPEVRKPAFTDANCAWGASASSWDDLMHRHGYQMVAVTHMLDLFYVREDLLTDVVVPSSPEYFDTADDNEPSFGGHLHHVALRNLEFLDQLVDTRVFEDTGNLKLAKAHARGRILANIGLGEPFTLQCFAEIT
eukprot:CAMPEP_0119016264 /NCGR_PEP_ID=MMETSP1176-20130426/11901_1 /TAXON_ID=265551 /ORGANISM="Synedropsis recta cf, Strain CCMP1620" /LENGTH=364 /DNA_ID=CAMNT_0006969605 /DNA_START=134 /DNA_END=1224 /DNA_ORIENTATION=+